MKLNKSLVTCAVAMALSSTTVFADQKDVNGSIDAKYKAQAVGNTMVINQTSGTGVTWGNDLRALQDGDLHKLTIDTVGEGNSLETVQVGQGNLLLLNTVGNENSEVYQQNGESNGALTELNGQGNQMQ